MKEQDPEAAFGESHAANYDTNFARLAPMKEALHLCMRMVLAPLPEGSRAICVGAGTGAELLTLAEAFPSWSFALVEPSAPMLAVCRRRAEEAGITSRCTFHHGYLDSLPPTEPFDVATSILVSQFVLNIEARAQYFREIAERLRPGGYLVNADLCADLSFDATGGIIDVWMETMRYNGSTGEKLAQYRSALGQKVAVTPENEIATLIGGAGFTTPVRFCQTVLIHAWYARRSTAGRG